MALRKEPFVFAGTVLVLGWLFWSSRGEGGVRVSRNQRAPAPELAHHAAPDPALVLPAPRAAAAGRPRDLFSPPSDTNPLPPLELAPLPRAPLAMLAPPPDPGPEPALYGRFLRVKPYRIDAPNLFEAGTEPGVEATDPAAELVPGTKPAELTAEEKAERISGLKKLYDWVRTVEFKFGQIKNPNRYQLSRRPGEDILFVEFNPATGLPRLPKQGPVPISRSLVTEFDFADTVLNQIEKRRAEFDDPLSASQYPAALAFADECVDLRLETPRALEVAEEMYRRAMPVLSEDPAPHLGLARCFEAGFEFEKAFQEYRSLLAGAHERDPLVLSRLAALEARFRLFQEADEHFAEAERFGRAQWSVQHAYGRYLLEQGRVAQAVEHLKLASQYEPAGAERKRERARIRVDLATALLRTGDVRGAAEWFEKGKQADPGEQRALAGALSAASVGKEAGGTNGAAGAQTALGAEPSSVGFDLLLASGIEAIGHRDADSAERARRNLELAAAADPFRAHLAWRALSFLAEVTGHPEEALRYADQAVENGPDDAYALYHRGRLLAERDDLEGAMQSFSRRSRSSSTSPTRSRRWGRSRTGAGTTRRPNGTSSAR
jgi:tetratricopeptide (TPR) repeat protein